MNNHQPIIDLLQKAQHDADLRIALEQATTPADAVRVAETVGMTVSEDQVLAFREHVQSLQQQGSEGELNEAELEHVAGGFDPFTLGLAGVGIVAIGGVLGVSVGGGALAAGIHYGVDKLRGR